MSCYSFKIKKGEFELCVSSEDRYFVLMQFNRLYEQLVGKQKPAKPVKHEKADKEDKKPKSKKIEPEIEPEIVIEPQLAVKPEVKLPEPEPVKAVSEPEPIKEVDEPKPEKALEKAAENPESEQTSIPPELPQELPVVEVEEIIEEKVVTPQKVEKVELAPKVEVAPEVVVPVVEDKPAEAAEVLSEEATVEEVAAVEEPEETVIKEEVEDEIVVSSPKIEVEPEVITGEASVVEEISANMVEEPSSLDVVEPEAAAESGDEEDKEDDAFARIMAMKMQDDSEPADDEEPESTENLEDEEEDDVKETITYYDEEEDTQSSDAAPLDEESELASALNKSFKEEEPAVETKKNKIYDILQQKLSSLPKAELSRLNLFNKPKVDEPEVVTSAKPQDIPSFNSFDDLLVLKKPQTKLDYLLVTAYFLQEGEIRDKYPLKLINAKVIPILKEAIDHSVIHEAVAHSYLQVMPDASGGTDVTEYAITTEGIDYILNEL